MPFTHEENLSAIRRRLGYPLGDAPSDPQLMQLLVDQLANYNAELANTVNHWSVDHYQLPVNQGQEDYLVTAPNFGRPFLVYSVDGTDPYHARREIPIRLLQDADQLYSGPQQSYSSLDDTLTAICFYRRYENWMARAVPIPGGPGTYEVWYETVYEYGSPSDQIGLSAFHHLLRVRTAISALPLVEWRDCSPRLNAAGWQMKVAALRDSLVLDDVRFTKQFNSYKAQSSREGIGMKIPWGSMSGVDDDGIGAGRMASGWGW